MHSLVTNPNAVTHNKLGSGFTQNESKQSVSKKPSDFSHSRTSSEQILTTPPPRTLQTNQKDANISYSQTPSKLSANVERSTYLIGDSKLLDSLLRYEPLAKLVSESKEIQGYEMYIVEQWACERRSNSCIASYTGNPRHKVIVALVSLPSDAKLFNTFTVTYFDDLFKSHARPKHTEDGVIYVSNLSSFPSNLNLVPVRNGERVEWPLFDLNENLRRTGCSGRVVLSMTPTVSNASEDKFRQLFKIHENVPINFAVRELVTMVQICLYYCNLLPPEYVDGLLCNSTLKGVSLWWDRWGVAKYQIKPSNSELSTLSPKSVSALVGFVTGVRNRVASVISSSKSPKDPFDVEFFIDSLRVYQKHEHLPRTLRIDEITLDSLYSLTNTKNTNADFFFGIVKSTMKEVSGRTATGGVSDVETIDIDRMRSFVQGARSRYLWLGRGEQRKPLLNPSRATLSLGIPLSSLAPSERVPNKNDFKWTDIAGRKGRKGHIELVNQEIPQLIVENEGGLEDDDSSDGRHLRLLKEKSKQKLRKYINKARSPGTTDDEFSAFDEEYDTEAVENSEYYDDEEYDEVSGSELAHKEKDSAIEHSDQVLNEKVVDIDISSELRRRKSFEIRKFGHKNDIITEDNPSFKLSLLRRTQSSSMVDSYLFTWPKPWLTPEYTLASKYKTSLLLQKKAQKQVSLVEQKRIDYSLLTRKLETRLENDKVRLAGKLEKDIKALKERESGVLISLDETEALASRLVYEIRMLDGKMGDVEEAVDRFVSRVKGLEQRMDETSKSGMEEKEAFWYSKILNYFQ